MKCDHIRTKRQGDAPFFPNMLNNANVEVCLKEDVYAAIAELKQKLHDAEMRADLAECAETERRIDYDNLKKDLAYHARQIYFKHHRQTLRALWIARAKRALEKIAWFKLWNSSISTMNPEDGARQEFDKWKKSLGKFLKKAEEYKEDV